jgi:DNA polymerase epsilon subunit 2
VRHLESYVGDITSSTIDLEDDSQIEQEQLDVLKKIYEAIQKKIEKRELGSMVIDEAVLASVMVDLSEGDEDLILESTELIDAFSCPKLRFDERQRTYKVDPKPSYRLFGDVDSRASMYRERLVLTQQRILRSKNPRYKMKTFQSGGNSASGGGGASSKSNNSNSNSNSNSNDDSSNVDSVIYLHTVESLLGSAGVKCILGMITQPEDGRLHIEDLTGHMEIDFSNLSQEEGAACDNSTIITEGSQVLLRGNYNQARKIFEVLTVTMPPEEEREKGLLSMGLHDSFGVESNPTKIARMKELEEGNKEKMFVFISDILLDKPQVADKLGQVFKGYENIDQFDKGELIFILMGPFVSLPSTSSGGKDLAIEAFQTLAEIISEYPQIANNAKFVIVPGTQDPGMGKILPKRPIPDIFVEELKKRITHIRFASNPCRLRYYTQEIVIFRENLLRKMQRYSLQPILSPKSEGSGGGSSNNSNYNRRNNSNSSSDAGVFSPNNKGNFEEDEAEIDVTKRLVNSIVRQAHLLPLPMHAKPIYWELDHNFRLNPLPDLLVIGDQMEHFSHKLENTNVVNPGSFTSDFSFVVYRPNTRECERCMLR